jgi:hypothetical protein
MGRRRPLVVRVVAIVFLSMVAASTAALAQGRPSVSVTPSAALPGWSLTITGADWTAGATVHLAAGPPASEADPFGATRVGADGRFLYVTRLHSGATPGPYVLVAVAGSNRATARFEIVKLTTRGSKQAAATLRLPSDWRYRDATYPSDHSLEYWTDPHDSLSKARLEVSRCVGCVQPSSCVLNGVGCRPAPENVVPKGATWHRTSKTRVRFSGYTDDSPYPLEGVAVVIQRNGAIAGFARLELWLPRSQSRLAAALVASFSAR